MKTMKRACSGVRRAQLQLAAFFVELQDESRARRIIDDMKDEKARAAAGHPGNANDRTAIPILGVHGPRRELQLPGAGAAPIS